jgi:uncharacterized protein with PhoU and TrkA domain
VSTHEHARADSGRIYAQLDSLPPKLEEKFILALRSVSAAQDRNAIVMLRAETERKLSAAMGAAKAIIENAEYKLDMMQKRWD